MVEIGFGVIGGTGQRPYSEQSYLSGAVSSDHIYASHTLQFCRPIPDTPFAYLTATPPMTDCGSFSRDLKNFPLNNPTITSGNTRTFGKSEMVIAFLRLDNYQGGGGHIRFQFHRPDNSIMVVQDLDVPAPDPSWSWWYYWGWACVGRFDDTTGYSVNEIIAPGNYTVDVITSWGNAYISYDVVDTTPAPPMDVIFEVVGPGTFLIYKNSNLAATALPGSPKTVSFKIGDTFGYQAIADANAVFQKLCDVPQTECRPEPQYTYDIVGQIPGRFIATFTTVPPTKYSCLNGCSTAVYVGDYDSKAACLTGCAPPPPSCGNIAADSWSVNSVKVASGEAISFVIRSKDPNKSFLVMDTTDPRNPTTLITGATDLSGCYSGNMTHIDGRYTITVNLTNGILLFPIGSKVLQWGEVAPGPIDQIGELLKYAPLALGIMVAANVISALRSR